MLEITDDVLQSVPLSQHARTSSHASLSTANFVKAVSVLVCFPCKPPGGSRVQLGENVETAHI